MDKELVIGIRYRSDKSWIGGTYYIQNIVSCLNYVSCVKPRVIAFCETHDDFLNLQSVTNYPKLEEVIFQQGSKGIRRIFDRAYRIILRKETNFHYIGKRKYGFDFVYPYTPDIMRASESVSWIPDFQELHLPSLFSKEEIDKRYAHYKNLVEKKVPIVFSSNDALADFRKSIDSRYTSVYVVPFAVSHPVFSDEDIEEIKEKYGICDPYLFCANQFWAHKNHMFIFRAIQEARKRGSKLQLVCSGKVLDKRNPKYGESLLDYISENHLEEGIKLLGFISREEQLCLMANSYAIIQPSLFEGWNTTVEDAKCLNKFIFLSDINVHREQAPKNACYFDSYDIDDCVDKLLNVQPTKEYVNYDENRKVCGEAFLNIATKNG